MKTTSFCLLLLLLSGTSQTAFSQPPDQAVILQYHHVSEDGPPSTSLSPEAFREHMDYLEQAGFQVWSLPRIIDHLQKGLPLEDRVAAITFDDGYVSVYEQAYPLLKQRGWPFTIFVNSDLVGSNSRIYSDWEQLRDMGDNGATIANHTIDHPYLLEKAAGASDETWLQEVERQILTAEQIIARETGQKHRFLAYPYGEYNPQIQALVQELGFIAFAQHSGPINAASDMSALPRFPFSGIYASLNTFQTKVNSLAFTVLALNPNTPITTQSMPNVRIQLKAGDFRAAQLNCYAGNQRLEIRWLDRDELIFEISADSPQTSRRFRYNCTAPASDGSRYYWYSVPWINPQLNDN